MPTPLQKSAAERVPPSQFGGTPASALFSTTDQTDQKQNDGNDEQDVDEVTDRDPTHDSEQPEDDQNDGNGEEHDMRLRQVLQRFREAGLTLRKEKCQLGRPEVKWFGMIFSEEGMVADPAKTEVIRRWPRPKTVRDVKSFLQTVQFNSVYMAAEPGEMNYPELTEPLRALTRAGRKFTWTEEHQKHFHLIKERLAGEGGR